MNLNDYISEINSTNQKVLSIFLTAGFPDKENFVSLAEGILNSGADMLEIGFPFSDPIADGPVIQYSSQKALENKVSIQTAFDYIKEIKSHIDKPLILMGYANTILSFGVENFFTGLNLCGADGLIVPDVPLEEYDSFFGDQKGKTSIILLTTPSSSNERIKEIDSRSSGFLYCVSVNGTTGERSTFTYETIEVLKRTYSLVNNKMLIGFGISNAESITSIAPYCDGVIVGSAVIKKLIEVKDHSDYSEIFNFIRELKNSCCLD
jgi:tryptophan synthase alpha chain